MNRDPLFSILVFVAIIVVVATIGYWLGHTKRTSKQKALDKFLDGFAITEGSDFKEIGAFASMSPSFIEPLCMLAKGYAHSGEFEKAITLLQSVLKNMSKFEKTKELSVLHNLAEVYQEAGMLHRASETILQMLGIDSRNMDAIFKLVILREMQGEYEKALEALSVLEELGRVDAPSRQYLESLRDLKQGKKVVSNSRYFQRLALQEALLNGTNAQELIDKVDIKTALDLLWFCDKEFSGELHDMIFASKCGKDISHNAPFALKVMAKIMPLANANLRFSYKCEICGYEDTLFFGRCPKCQSADACFVDASVVQATPFESAMFT